MAQDQELDWIEQDAADKIAAVVNAVAPDGKSACWLLLALLLSTHKQFYTDGDTYESALQLADNFTAIAAKLEQES